VNNNCTDCKAPKIDIMSQSPHQTVQSMRLLNELPHLSLEPFSHFSTMIMIMYTVQFRMVDLK